MKIGTITFWDSEDNYGQILQCYALIKFLKLQGHEPFLIKYKRQRNFYSILKRIFEEVKFFFKSPFAIVQRFKSRFFKRRALKEIVNRNFSDFRRKHIPSTSQIYSDNSLYREPPIADAYICGSDQIWAGGNPIMYLQFVPNDCIKIAYSASFGGRIPKNLKEISRYLNSFNYVSLREKSGVALCNELGCFSAELVPDPTLLLSSEIYRQLCPEISNKSNRYILLYLLGNDIPISVDVIFEFAKLNNIEIKYVASQGRKDCFAKIYPTIEEWIDLIDNASYIITNSFHGTVFSLLLNTPFLVIPLSGSYKKMNVRIYDLLDKYDLKNRIYDGKLDEVFNCMNFDTFNESQISDIHKIVEVMDAVLKQ